jgi:hypothetical protein
MIIYDPSRLGGVAEEAFFDNNQPLITKIINNEIPLSFYDKLFTYLVCRRSVPAKLLRVIFHTGGIVFGGCLRDYFLKIDPDPSSDVDFIISYRVLNYIKNNFNSQFIFIDYNHKYPLEIKINNIIYRIGVTSCTCKKSGIKILDFISLYDNSELQLGKEYFQTMVIIEVLLKKVNYDINRCYWLPEKKGIMYVQKANNMRITDMNITRKVLTVNGLENSKENMNGVSISRTIKLLRRKYYLLDRNWCFFFQRKGSIKHRRFLINNWKEIHREIFGYLILNLNSDIIGNILPYFVEWETIVCWTVHQLLDSIKCPWKILPDDIRSMPQLINIVRNYFPITQKQMKYIMSFYQKKNQ